MITAGELLSLMETHPDCEVSFAGQSGRCLYNREKQEFLFDDEHEGEGYEEVDSAACASLADMLRCFPKETVISVMGMIYEVAVCDGLILLDDVLPSTPDIVEEFVETSLIKRYKTITAQTINALIDREWQAAEIQDILGLTYDSFQSYIN